MKSYQVSQHLQLETNSQLPAVEKPAKFPFWRFSFSPIDSWFNCSANNDLLMKFFDCEVWKSGWSWVADVLGHFFGSEVLIGWKWKQKMQKFGWLFVMLKHPNHFDQFFLRQNMTPSLGKFKGNRRPFENLAFSPTSRNSFLQMHVWVDLGWPT